MLNGGRKNTTMTWFNGDSSQVKVKRMTKEKVYNNRSCFKDIDITL